MSSVDGAVARAHAALIHALGGAACVLPVPAAAGGDLLEVGQLAGLPVWSLVATPAEAARMARRLARHGQLGVLFGQEHPATRLALAVTIAPTRVAVSEAASGPATIFRRLQGVAARKFDTSLEAALALADALDLDVAGRRTFRLLHGLVRRGIEHLPHRVPVADRHAWVLTQLTRLLFLRFVESEGWLDGNSRFLAENFDRCLLARRDPTRHFLHPLFFGTLNREWHRRSRFARALGAVPFLNGGLFEPHAVERRHPLRLPALYWCEVFEALVQRVEVTLDREPDRDQVTPEMLGRVFEGVMEPEERQREGTFFTPPDLVDGMLRAAIAAHLASMLRRPEGALVAALDDPDPALRRGLLDIRVLDPAVGSGAFLIGALGLLHGPGPRRARRVLHLVSRRLFGVDRHPTAVRLTELRLWLEVLRARRGSRPDSLPPLPNLDASVRTGDALIEPLVIPRDLREAVRAIDQRQKAVRSAHGPEHREAWRRLIRAERDVLRGALAREEVAITGRIRTWIEVHQATTLFGERVRVSRSERAVLKELRRQRREIRQEIRRLDRDALAAPFAMTVAFAPVTVRRGGFDLVVGNPPWVRAERLSPERRARLRQSYRWWRGHGRGWRHDPDLAIAFVERSLNLLRPGGTLALLVPAKVTTAGYGAHMREALTTRAMLHCVADLTDDPRAGFEATTYPLALVASRRTPEPEHRVRLGLDASAPSTRQREWEGVSRWSLASPEVQAAGARLAREFPPLAESVTAQLGVKTGANELFVNPPEAVHPWCRPALRGRDIAAFEARAGCLLLWAADDRGAPWRELPDPLAEYFTRHRARLEQRRDLQRGPPWRLFRTSAATARHRVAWSDLAAQLRAAALPAGAVVPLNSCYVARVGSARAAEALTAWLNSTWIGALARAGAERASGGFARFGARAVGAVPLPPAVLGDAVLAGFTHAAPHHDVREALDGHVADLLGLDAHERSALASLAAHRR